MFCLDVKETKPDLDTIQPNDAKGNFNIPKILDSLLDDEPLSRQRFYVNNYRPKKLSHCLICIKIVVQVVYNLTRS